MGRRGGQQVWKEQAHYLDYTLYGPSVHTKPAAIIFYALCVFSLLYYVFFLLLQTVNTVITGTAKQVTYSK